MSLLDNRSSLSGAALRVKRVISPKLNKNDHDFQTGFSSPNLIEYSEDILGLNSPALKSIKRRKSNLGGAGRVKTPSKPTVLCENDENDENDEKYMNVLRPITPIHTTKPMLIEKTPVVKPAVVSMARTRLSNDSVASESSEGAPRAWLVDDFVLGKPLGRGKFGNVYHAKQKTTSCPVALKVLFKAQMQAAKCVNTLRREVEIQSRLQHPNIVQLTGYTLLQLYISFELDC
jgi:hypothetical protein